MRGINRKKLVYLDNSATTQIDPAVLKSMLPYLRQNYGNPSSLHRLGIKAKQAINQSRKTVAQILGARENEIIFTAGGTESINLAILGKNYNYNQQKKKKYHIITSAIEHHAVLKCFDRLEKQGFKVSRIGVDHAGFIRLEDLKNAVCPETVFISIMYANNEIGTIEPIAKIARWLALINKQRIREGFPKIVFHTDACQASGSLDLNVNRLGVDMLSVTASKIYGPKQMGFLYVRSGIKLEPIILGGGQENNLRNGTENVPGIVGLAKALALCQKNRIKENKRLRDLRNYFISKIQSNIPNTSLNGPDLKTDSESKPTRLANNVNFSFQGVNGEAVVFYLDKEGIEVSTGSACSSVISDPSHVILATGKNKKYAESTIRFSLGKNTKKFEIDFTIKVLANIIFKKFAQN